MGDPRRNLLLDKVRAFAACGPSAQQLQLENGGWAQLNNWFLSGVARGDLRVVEAVMRVALQMPTGCRLLEKQGAGLPLAVEDLVRKIHRGEPTKFGEGEGKVLKDLGLQLCVRWLKIRKLREELPEGRRVEEMEEEDGIEEEETESCSTATGAESTEVFTASESSVISVVNCDEGEAGDEVEEEEGGQKAAESTEVTPTPSSPTVSIASSASSANSNVTTSSKISTATASSSSSAYPATSASASGFSSEEVLNSEDDNQLTICVDNAASWGRDDDIRSDISRIPQDSISKEVVDAIVLGRGSAKEVQHFWPAEEYDPEESGKDKLELDSHFLSPPPPEEMEEEEGEEEFEEEQEEEEEKEEEGDDLEEEEEGSPQQSNWPWEYIDTASLLTSSSSAALPFPSLRPQDQDSSDWGSPIYSSPPPQQVPVFVPPTHPTYRPVEPVQLPMSPVPPIPSLLSVSLSPPHPKYRPMERVQLPTSSSLDPSPPPPQHLKYRPVERVPIYRPELEPPPPPPPKPATPLKTKPPTPQKQPAPLPPTPNEKIIITGLDNWKDWKAAPPKQRKPLETGNPAPPPKKAVAPADDDGGKKKQRNNGESGHHRSDGGRRASQWHWNQKQIQKNQQVFKKLWYAKSADPNIQMLPDEY